MCARRKGIRNLENKKYSRFFLLLFGFNLIVKNTVPAVHLQDVVVASRGHCFLSFWKRYATFVRFGDISISFLVLSFGVSGPNSTILFISVFLTADRRQLSTIVQNENNSFGSNEGSLLFFVPYHIFRLSCFWFLWFGVR